MASVTTIPVYSLHDLCGLRLSVLFVGECVYVRGKTRRGRSIDTGDMMVYSDLAYGQRATYRSPGQEEVLTAYMFGIPCGLLQEMDKIRRAQLAKGDEGLGTSVDGFLKDLLRDPARRQTDKSARGLQEGEEED